VRRILQLNVVLPGETSGDVSGDGVGLSGSDLQRGNEFGGHMVCPFAFGRGRQGEQGGFTCPSSSCDVFGEDGLDHVLVAGAQQLEGPSCAEIERADRVAEIQPDPSCQHLDG
jgi:hypothetical protein